MKIYYTLNLGVSWSSGHLASVVDYDVIKRSNNYKSYYMTISYDFKRTERQKNQQQAT